jgi:hypothetical protein
MALINELGQYNPQRAAELLKLINPQDNPEDSIGDIGDAGSDADEAQTTNRGKTLTR